MTEELNLSTVFKEITKVLATNRQQLDDADEYNHNHGSNMVHTFNLIQQAVASKETEPASEQLAFASKILADQSTGSTAQIYAEGLAKASQEFVGKDFNASTAGTLINSMMGMGGGTERGAGDFLSTLLGSLSKPEAQQETQAPAPAQPTDLFGSLIGNLTAQQPVDTTPSQPDVSDLLGGLLGGMTGQQQTPATSNQPDMSDLLGGLLGGMTGQQQTNTTNNQPDASDLLGGLLGGLTGSASSSSQSSSGGIGDLVGSLLGGQSSGSQSSGLDAKDLLSLGLAYFAAKQSGQSNLQAIMQALASASPLGKRQDQQQSGALVINTILNMLGKK
ncbi:MAG: dihydroxyacetone kinase subunit L [Chloroflexi bacterium]|nr:dihydroxyacetone kinase subunit L [Chloroflexota bacterium]